MYFLRRPLVLHHSLVLFERLCLIVIIHADILVVKNDFIFINIFTIIIIILFLFIIIVLFFFIIITT